MRGRSMSSPDPGSIAGGYGDQGSHAPLAARDPAPSAGNMDRRDTGTLEAMGRFGRQRGIQASPKAVC